MSNITKSFLSCVSLSTVLALGACGSEPRFEETAQFSGTSESKIVASLQAAEIAQTASLAIPLIALFDAASSENGCPQVTETGIVGNGCESSNGTRYDGSFELVQNDVEEFTSVIYRGFRYEESDFSFYLDGSVIFARESEDTVRYDLDLVTEFRFDVGVKPERTESQISAICELGAEGGARCTLEPGAAAKVAGLGGFSIEGFHQIDYTGEPGNTSELTLQGADSLFYEYVGATDCYTYTIEGGEPQNSCDE
jgi:hypothetical protein